jgi:hypothetical protein
MTTLVGATTIALCGLYFGFKLTQQGAKGEFTIRGEGGDVKGFITSVSPGLGFAFLGCVVAVYTYRIQRLSWGLSSPKYLKQKQIRQSKPERSPSGDALKNEHVDSALIQNDLNCPMEF